MPQGEGGALALPMRCPTGNHDVNHDVNIGNCWKLQDFIAVSIEHEYHFYWKCLACGLMDSVIGVTKEIPCLGPKALIERCLTLAAVVNH